MMTILFVLSALLMGCTDSKSLPQGLPQPCDGHAGVFKVSSITWFYKNKPSLSESHTLCWDGLLIKKEIK